MTPLKGRALLATTVMQKTLNSTLNIWQTKALEVKPTQINKNVKKKRKRNGFRRQMTNNKENNTFLLPSMNSNCISRQDFQSSLKNKMCFLDLKLLRNMKALLKFVI